MTNNINEMFNTVENNETTTNARNLAGTAQLTTVANTLVADCMAKLSEQLDDYKELFMESQKDHNAMDKLLAMLIDFDAIDVEFISSLDEQTIDGMLKSQQSKRSRAKNKLMTMDNYKNMMAGAIAENLIRKATGKAKMATGIRRAAGSLEFTEEELEQLKEDQERLKKEIRNIQSKKSIMKSKEDFTEEDEHWKKLLEVEEQLKSLRVSTRATRIVKVDETKEKLASAFADVDLEHIKAADSKALLAQIKEMLGQ